MKLAVQAAGALCAALLFGWWWFAPAPVAQPTDPRVEPAEHAAAAPTSRSGRPPARSPHIGEINNASTDDQLEAVMIDHHDAIQAVLEAYHDELFRDGGPLAACYQGRDGALCWLRFHARLRGQQLSLRLDGVECRGDDTLGECVTAHAVPGDPLGIPSEAADDLGDYDGPLEVPLQWSPGWRGSAAADGR